MSNATQSLKRQDSDVGEVPMVLPVKGSTALYAFTLVSQSSGGYLVPYSTASSSSCVGMVTHDEDNSAGSDGDKSAKVVTKKMVRLANGTSSDAFADTDIIGSIVYGTDDHTAAKTSNSHARQPVGFFYGFEDDGRVRVFLDPAVARICSLLAALTDSPATADALRDNIVAQF